MGRPAQVGRRDASTLQGQQQRICAYVLGHIESLAAGTLTLSRGAAGIERGGGERARRWAASEREMECAEWRLDWTASACGGWTGLCVSEIPRRICWIHRCVCNRSCERAAGSCMPAAWKVGGTLGRVDWILSAFWARSWVLGSKTGRTGTLFGIDQLIRATPVN